MRTLYRLLFLPVLLVSCAWVMGEPPSGFQNEIVVVGLDQPTVIEFTPDGRMLVGELQEEILVVQPNASLPDAQPFLRLDNTGIFGGQGLMDIKVDPDFDANGYFYVYYTKGPLNRNRVSRFTASGNSTLAGSEVVLWQDIQPAQEEHQGGALAIGPEGRLYITVGEAFVPQDAQQLTSYRGKLLRINRDGSVPADNPFHDGDGPNLDAIWAMGLRNPFRCSFDAVSGRLYIGEVGGNDNNIAVEELNLGTPGANYGWPDCEGACGTAGFTSPVYSYPHAGRDASLIGGFVYRGNQFPSSYFGSYIFADYAQNWIRRLTFDANGNVSGVFNFEPADGTPDGDYGDPTCLKQGPDGALYYADFSHDPDNYWAMVRRIRYVGSNQPPVVFASATPKTGLPALNVAFSSLGSMDPEGKPLTYSWTFGDGQNSAAANPGHTYSQAGMFSARLAVSDGVNTSLSAPLTIIVGTTPTVTIQSPTDGATFRAGESISFSGTGADAEDGPLPPGALDWNIVFHHGEHIHPVFGPWSETNRGEVLIPGVGHAFGYDTSYELILIATDSTGLQASDSVTIHPELVDLSFSTEPSGLTIKVDGISRVTPFTDGSLIGFQHSLEAPNQTSGTSNYTFQTWTDGGAQSHAFIVPPQDQTLIAQYRPVIPGALLIESASRQSNSFHLKFRSIAGRFYRVERSPTMQQGSWVTVTDQLPGTGASVEVVDASTNAAAQGFYRVELLPLGTFGSPGFATAAGTHGLNVAVLNTSLDATGDNRVLVVGLCWNDHSGDSVAAVTYAGATCTHLLTTNWFYGTGKVALYGLTAPPPGNNVLQVTMSGSASELSMTGVLFTNANQIASFGTAAANFSGGPATDVGVSVTSAPGDLVVDVLGYYAFDPMPGSGQSLRIAAVNTGNASLRMSTKPGVANATSMSWSMSGATEISQIGIAIKSR